MTNASAGLRQQHSYHQCFYPRMFKASIPITVKVWFGADAAAMPGARSFSRSSAFCNSWRNAFSYNRAVSNRNEFVQKSRYPKYAATGDNHALNLHSHGFCRDADPTCGPTHNCGQKPENKPRADLPPFDLGPRKRNHGVQ